MANQSPDRRLVLEMIAKAAVASQFPGFSKWVFAGESRNLDTASGAKTAGYTPSFFSGDEYRMIDVLTEMIIPRDESPGARDAGVSEFIDFMAAHGELAIQQPMQSGLRWLNSQAKQRYGAVFVNLQPAGQTSILKTVAYRDQADAADEQGRQFFELIRRYTVMGYYTSRMGLEELDYPGLKMYSHSPACPHTNDPEHLHLPPPGF